MKSVKVTKFWFGVCLIVVIALTILTRFYALTNKPIHFDESINGWFVMQMESLGYYKYDPHNYHGPLYFYILHLFEMIWGRSLETLRAVPSFFSVLSVLVFTLPILQSRRVSLWIAVFVLLSPAFLFFGRSGIHEMSFVFFQILVALGFLRWLERPDAKALGLLLVGLFGMMTLKETFVITLFSGAVALCTLGWRSLREILSWQKIKSAWNRQLTLLLLVLILVFVQVFTGFFRNPAGLTDFVKSFLPWLKTGVHGQGHDKSTTYWLQVLWQAEPIVLIGIFLALVGLFSKQHAWRFISAFSLVQLAVYSFVPYKTIWCILSLVWGFYFVLAYALKNINTQRVKIFLWCLIGISFLVNFQSAYRSVYATRLSFDHPYIYVNSSYEFQELQDFIMAAAKKNPALLEMPMQIGMVEQWPWPWVLRSFNVASYQHCGKLMHPDAVIYFCDPEDMLKADRHFDEAYWKMTLPMRKDRGISYVYLKKSVFPEVPFANATLEGDDQE